MFKKCSLQRSLIKIGTPEGIVFAPFFFYSGSQNISVDALYKPPRGVHWKTGSPEDTVFESFFLHGSPFSNRFFTPGLAGNRFFIVFLVRFFVVFTISGSPKKWKKKLRTFVLQLSIYTYIKKNPYKFHIHSLWSLPGHAASRPHLRNPCRRHDRKWPTSIKMLRLPLLRSQRSEQRSTT